MLWGYANGWFPEFLSADDDVIYAKLKFVLNHGLSEISLDLDALLELSQVDRDRLGTFLAENDLHITPQVWFDYVHASDEEASAQRDRIIAALRELQPLLRNYTVFTKAGCGQRFDREVPLHYKLDRLAERMAPIAAACHEMGTPLGINNQGDFYIADFVGMCERIPHLMLHIDTANIFWGGEPIFPAFERAAPYTVGTHWRDEICEIGVRKPRGVMLHNCVTGQGDVDLRRCYHVLLQKAPDPDRLVMEIEMFPQRELPKDEALEQALEFCRSLEGGA